MIDGIINDTKSSRLLKADLPATYDELVALAANAGVPADVLFNAAGWQQLPTFLNKKNLLQDSTAGLLGLTGDPTVDDAFLGLLLVVKQAALVRVTVTVAGEPAMAGVEVTGLAGLDGGAVYTDDTGTVVAFAEAGEVNLSTVEYQDLPSASTVTKQVEAGQIFDVALSVSSAPQAGNKTITTTTPGIRFSPYVTGVDVHCINGGFSGGGAYGSYSDDGISICNGGVGGRAGAQKYENGIVPDYTQSYTAIVGAGGPSIPAKLSWENPNSTQTDSNPGGLSSFMGVEPQLNAGVAGGLGASLYAFTATPATPGASDTVHVFGDSSKPVYGGAGGGGGTGTAPAGSNASGGTPGGGRGGTAVTNSLPTRSGDSGSSYGAGGGGAPCSQRNISFAVGQSGAGYQGAVFFRWRVV